MAGDPLVDKVPPHSIEAEMSVLGAMLLDPAAADIVVQHLTEDCFYLPQHRTLYKILLEFIDARKPIDNTLLVSALQSKGLTEEVGGQSYIIALCDSTPTVANAEYYAKVVKDKALLRGLIQAGAEIIRDGHSTDGTVEDICDRCEQRIFDITERKIVAQASDIRSILAQMIKTLDFQSQRAITGVETGLHQLDGMTRGLQPGELIILAARPSVGKSALALNIAEHVAADLRQPVAFFSLEMSKEELALRLLSSRARIDGQKIRKGMLSASEARSIQDVASVLYEVPLYIDDSPGMRVLDLRAKARRLYMRHSIKLLVVDYLQLMSAPGAESRQVEVANISRGLKALARELKIPVLAVAQLRRPAPNQPHTAVPQLSDLRESGAIEQDADVVMLLDRAATRLKPDNSEEYRHALNQAELIVAKQRNGPTGLVPLTWRYQFTRFETREDDYVPQEPSPQPDDAAPTRRVRPVQANLGQMGPGEDQPPDDEAPSPF
jgi:replicative DNA helicase